MRRTFWTILVVALVVRLVMVFLTPPLFAPDEGAHVLYVHAVAMKLSFPVQSRDILWAYHFGADEFAQAPLFYIVAAPIYRVFSGLGEPVVYAVRVLNAFLGVAVVALVFRIGRLVFPQRRLVAYAATVFTALLPTFIGNSSSVNNDVLCTLLVAFATERMIALLRAGGAGVKQAVLLGVIGGLALLTKTSALVLLPAMLTWGWFLPKARHLGLVAAAVALVMVSPWWLGRNLVAYGDLLGVDVGAHPASGPIITRVLQQAPFMAASFWSNFGRTYDVHIPGLLVLVPLATVVVSSAVGMYAWMRDEDQPRVASAAFAVLGVLFGVLLLATLRYGVLFAHGEGRYLFPALPFVALAVGAGVVTIAGDRARAGVTLMGAAMAVWLAAATTIYIAPAFSRVVVERHVGQNDATPFVRADYQAWIARRTAPLSK